MIPLITLGIYIAATIAADWDLTCMPSSTIRRWPIFHALACATIGSPRGVFAARAKLPLPRLGAAKALLATSSAAAALKNKCLTGLPELILYRLILDFQGRCHFADDGDGYHDDCHERLDRFRRRHFYAPSMVTNATILMMQHTKYRSAASSYLPASSAMRVELIRIDAMIFDTLAWAGDIIFE